MFGESIINKQSILSYRYSRGVDVKLIEDSESFFEQFVLYSDVCNVRSVVVIQLIDVVHDAGTVSFDRGQDKQVLQVPNKTCKSIINKLMQIK